MIQICWKLFWVEMSRGSHHNCKPSWHPPVWTIAALHKGRDDSNSFSTCGSVLLSDSCRPSCAQQDRNTVATCMGLLVLQRPVPREIDNQRPLPQDLKSTANPCICQRSNLCKLGPLEHPTLKPSTRCPPTPSEEPPGRS